MAEYWVMDESGLVLGPVGLQVLRDIAAATQLGHLTRASTDGKTWVSMLELPEVAAAVLPPAMAERRARDVKEAERITRELERIRDMPTHALFGVPEGSPARVCREGYVALAKPYHPGRLPMDAHPDLLRACTAMFQFLSARMAQVEQQERTRTSGVPDTRLSSSVPAARLPTPVPPTRTASPVPGTRVPSSVPDTRLSSSVPGTRATPPPPPPAAARPPPPPPSAHLQTLVPGTRVVAPVPPPAPPAPEPVQLRRAKEDRFEAQVRVTRANCGMFTEHPLVNLATGGVFLPHTVPPQLGSFVDVVFQFDDASREVRARGKVICENTVEGRQARGFGLRLDALSADDKAFLQQYVSRAQKR